MNGSSSRRKGYRGEKEVQEILHGACISPRILTARRVPLSGSAPDNKGDLLVGEICEHEDVQTECMRCHGSGIIQGSEERFEVKRRAQGFKKIDQYLQDNFAVVYRADHGEWIVTMRLKDWIG